MMDIEFEIIKCKVGIQFNTAIMDAIKNKSHPLSLKDNKIYTDCENEIELLEKQKLYFEKLLPFQ